MKTINYREYNPTLGILIDVRPKYEFISSPTKYATNIPEGELIFNHKKYLNKNKTYYIICSGGVKSRKVVNILNVYGYNAINVVR